MTNVQRYPSNVASHPFPDIQTGAGNLYFTWCSAEVKNSTSLCFPLDLTCTPITLFLLNSQRALWDAVVIIVGTHTHARACAHTHKQKLQISLGTSHCRQCLIALRGEREARMKTGADLPPLLFSSHAFSTPCFSPFSFFPPPGLSSSHTARHFLSSDSIIESDCGVKGKEL